MFGNILGPFFPLVEGKSVGDGNEYIYIYYDYIYIYRERERGNLSELLK